MISETKIESPIKKSSSLIRVDTLVFIGTFEDNGRS
jgi:hypothetical protein